MIDLYEKGKAKFGWWQDWRRECVAIIASGPSVKKAGVDQLKDRIHVIAINENHQLCPWADILYSCDHEWWRLRGSEIKNFNGIKLGFEVSVNGVQRINILKRQGEYVHDLLVDEPGTVGSGANSGFQTINLAAQFGVGAIALVGFDMRLDQGIHWHGVHKTPMRNPDDERCRKWKGYIDGIADKLQANGIDMVNCSETSRLERYPKMTIPEALKRWNL